MSAPVTDQLNVTGRSAGTFVSLALKLAMTGKGTSVFVGAGEGVGAAVGVGGSEVMVGVGVTVAVGSDAGPIVNCHARVVAFPAESRSERRTE